jgi:hypothetical protein
MKTPPALFAFALLVACRGEAPEVGATPDPQLDSMVNQQAESAAPGSVMVSETLLRGVGYDKGELQDFHVEMTAGNCYVIVGAADETVTSLHVTVWDPNNKRVGQDRSKSREALVQHCPKETGSYKIQGKIGRGAGHFAIGVFGKEAPEKGAVAEEPKANKADLKPSSTPTPIARPARSKTASSTRAPPRRASSTSSSRRALATGSSEPLSRASRTTTSTRT